MRYCAAFSIIICVVLCLAACAQATATTPENYSQEVIGEILIITPESTLTSKPPAITSTQTPSVTPTSLPKSTAARSPTATAVAEPTGTPIGESTFDGTRVTIIHNAGFLITVGDKRVLIDAIYTGYPGGILKPILESQPPFDGVELIIATHDHPDHFDPELVRGYLQVNPETQFVSNPAAVEALLALDTGLRPRLTAVDLGAGDVQQLNIAGVELEAMHLSHGMPGILNLGFIISLDGVTLFHMGDMDPAVVSVSDLQAYGLPGKRIDIAFIHEYLFAEEQFHTHVTEGIQARHLIPMHFPVCNPLEGIEDMFEGIQLFGAEFDSWIMP